MALNRGCSTTINDIFHPKKNSWMFLWLSRTDLHDDEIKIRHRTLYTLLLRFTGSSLLDTLVKGVPFTPLQRAVLPTSYCS